MNQSRLTIAWGIVCSSRWGHGHWEMREEFAEWHLYKTITLKKKQICKIWNGMLVKDGRVLSTYSAMLWERFILTRETSSEEMMDELMSGRHHRRRSFSKKLPMRWKWRRTVCRHIRVMPLIHNIMSTMPASYLSNKLWWDIYYQRCILSSKWDKCLNCIRTCIIITQ